MLKQVVQKRYHLPLCFKELMHKELIEEFNVNDKIRHYTAVFRPVMIRK
jgi:hypothetical protein